MIERISNGRYLNGNMEFHRTEAKINQILKALHQQLGETGRELLEHLSEAYSH